MHERAHARKSGSNGSGNAAPLARSAPAANHAQQQPAPSSYGFDLSGVPTYTRHAPPALQTKLAVGGARDEFESEADSVAERIMRMPARSQGPSADLRRAPAATAQTKPAASGAMPSPLRAPAIVDDVLRAPGQPLDTATRAFMEPRFGQDFSNVRVHSGEKAARSAAAISARAYTYGNDIVLGAGSSDSASHLMAHELAHVRQQQAGGAPVVRRSKLATQFGEFEDVNYQKLTDDQGRPVGVEMYMKFHPGTAARADQIGLTQSAESKLLGGQVMPPAGGLRSATKGTGTGTFIDQNEGNPNPIFPTVNTVNTGGDPKKLGDYQTKDVTNQPPQNGPRGQHHDGFGKFGFRKVVAGAFVTQPAELYDPAYFGMRMPNSEQVFETAALAVSGAQANTYYGSVEWGWRRDASGNFALLPFRVLSQGVPTANFLTAANIWNQSKASVGVVTTTATPLLKDLTSQAVIATIPANTELARPSQGGVIGFATYYGVTYNGAPGFVDGAALRVSTIGADTVKLPVPIVYTVSNPAGTSMVSLSAPAASGPPPAKLALPAGTRISVTRSMKPTPELPNHEEGEVIDGPNTGTRGYFFVPDLKQEALGTR